MGPEHFLAIVLALVAVLVVAGFLIAVVWNLRVTHLDLIGILGAVVETVEKTDGLEGVVNEIADDLLAGQAALADCVDRLEQRLSGQANGAAPPGAVTPPPSSFSKY